MMDIDVGSFNSDAADAYEFGGNGRHRDSLSACELFIDNFVDESDEMFNRQCEKISSGLNESENLDTFNIDYIYHHYSAESHHKDTKIEQYNEMNIEISEDDIHIEEADHYNDHDNDDDDGLASICDCDEYHPLIIEMYKECGIDLSEFLCALAKKAIKLNSDVLKRNNYNRDLSSMLSSNVSQDHSINNIVFETRNNNIKQVFGEFSKHNDLENIPLAFYLARIVCYLNKCFGHSNIYQISSIGIYLTVSGFLLLIKILEKSSKNQSIECMLNTRNVHRLLMTSILISAKNLCSVQNIQGIIAQQSLSIDINAWIKVAGINQENEIIELEKHFRSCFEENELFISHDSVYKLTISTEADIEMKRYIENGSDSDSNSDSDSDDDEDDDEEEENGYSSEEDEELNDLLRKQI